jgi:hypothetical protein
MFDLQAGVHLDEVELAILIKELDGPGANVVDGSHGIGADLADLGARFFGDDRAGGFLEDLLVAALQRTVALAKVDRLALAIAKDLNLDVARPLQVFLDIDFVVAEGGLCLAAGGAEGNFDFFVVLGDLHAAPAAAGGCLDDDRIADFLGRRVWRRQHQPRRHRTPAPPECPDVSPYPWR